MKFLVVVIPPSIYHGCYTWKTFWGGRLTGKQDLFQSVNMKDCGRRRVRKQKEIKGSEKCVTLNISENFDSLNKMETTSSESKVKLERSGKGLVTALALNFTFDSEDVVSILFRLSNFSEIFKIS